MQGGKFILIFVCLMLGFFHLADSYDNQVIHPSLSLAAVELYNSQASRAISAEQSRLIIAGSIAEDADPRYLNHFYDPTTGQGLSDGAFTGLPAKAWAIKQDSATGDYSEEAILKNYRSGNLNRAYQGIGHQLHLIQDMAVPAHVRNDAHPGGDPYEAWAEQYGQVNQARLKFIDVADLNSAFDSLAGYTNSNFFSKDSININNLDNYSYFIKLVDGKNRLYFLNNIGNKSYILFYSKNPDSINPIFQIDDDLNLFIDYWNMLYPQAVGYSAGVIDYFEKKFRAVDQEEKAISNLSWWRNLSNQLTSAVSGFWSELRYGWGDTLLAGRIEVGNVVGWTIKTGKTGAREVGFFVEANQETVEQAAVLGIKISQELAENAVKLVTKSLPRQNLPQSVQIRENTAVNPAEESRPASIAPLGQPAPLADEPLLGLINPESKRTANQPVFFSGNNAVAPETAIISKPPLFASSSEAGFVFSSNEQGTFLCSLDDGAWFACPANSIFSNLSAGERKLSVKAVDRIHNQDQTPAEYVWQIDLTAPVVGLVSGPDLIASSSEAGFLFSSSEEPVDFSCRLDDRVLQICGASTTVSQLAEGAHAFYIKATDRAGNQSLVYLYNWLVDTVAPTSSLASMPGEYDKTGFAVSWSGEDIGSGLADYDIAYQAGGFGRVAWISATTATSAIFDLALEPGVLINFYSRARDNAGNISSWCAGATTSLATHRANHLVISELATRGPSGANDEFVELYNPTADTIALTGWKLQYQSASGTVWVNKAGSNGLTGGLVYPNKYYLLAGNGYSLAQRPDYRHSANWGLSDEGGHLRLVNNLGVEIDRLGYGTAANPIVMAVKGDFSSGAMVERKAVATSTAETMARGGAHENLGNGYDSHDNSRDFFVKTIPAPQAGANSAEPRSAADNLLHLWHFDECEGGYAYDSVGGQTIRQKTFWTPGRWGCASRQSWQPEYAIVETFSQPISGNQVSLSYYWRNYLYPEEGRGHVYLLDSSGKIMIGIAPSRYHITLYCGIRVHRTNYFDVEPDGTKTIMPNDNNWHQIFLSYDQNGLFFYVDGEFYHSLHDCGNLNDIASLKIAGENFPVERDELAIWNRAFGAEEIVEIYSAQRPFNPYQERKSQTAPELAHRWSFTEGEGATAADSIGLTALPMNGWWEDGKTGGGLGHTWGANRDIYAEFDRPIASRDLSLDFWYRNTAHPDEGRGRIVLKNARNEKIFGLMPSIYTGYYYFDNSSIYLGSILFNDKLWHHYAIVYDSYRYKFFVYLDGQEIYQKPAVWLNSPLTSLEIVGENWSYTFDEISIWQGALTPVQVRNIYLTGEL